MAYDDAISANDFDHDDVADDEPRCPECGGRLYSDEHAAYCDYDDAEEATC